MTSTRVIVFVGGRAHGERARTSRSPGNVIQARGDAYLITDTWTVHGYVAELL